MLLGFSAHLGRWLFLSRLIFSSLPKHPPSFENLRWSYGSSGTLAWSSVAWGSEPPLLAILLALFRRKPPLLLLAMPFNPASISSTLLRMHNFFFLFFFNHLSTLKFIRERIWIFLISSLTLLLFNSRIYIIICIIVWCTGLLQPLKQYLVLFYRLVLCGVDFLNQICMSDLSSVFASVFYSYLL